MKLKKVIYSIVSIVALTILTITPIAVKADTITSKIRATYSSNITPQTGDIFKITYKSDSDKKVNSFEIDASTIVNNVQALNLSTGRYTILSIEYKGDNETIKKEGYAIEENFEAKENPLTIKIAIGTERRDEMLAETLYVVTESGTDYNTYNKNKTNQGATTHPETTTIEEVTSETAAQQIATQDSSNVNKEELTAQVYNNQSKDNKSTFPIVYKLIPILIIAAGGSLTIFILHKKGKF